MNYFMLSFETFVAFGWIFRVGLHSSLIDDYLVLIASLLRQNLAIRTLFHTRSNSSVLALTHPDRIPFPSYLCAHGVESFLN